MPGKRFSYKPVHFLWAAKQLEKGTGKAEVARQFVARFGGNPASVQATLVRRFPAGKPI